MFVSSSRRRSRRCSRRPCRCRRSRPCRTPRRRRRSRCRTRGTGRTPSGADPSSCTCSSCPARGTRTAIGLAPSTTILAQRRCTPAAHLRRRRASLSGFWLPPRLAATGRPVRGPGALDSFSSACGFSATTSESVWPGAGAASLSGCALAGCPVARVVTLPACGGCAAPGERAARSNSARHGGGSHSRRSRSRSPSRRPATNQQRDGDPRSLAPINKHTISARL